MVYSHVHPANDAESTAYCGKIANIREAQIVDEVHQYLVGQNEGRLCVYVK